jgi:GNAT superfamily N-acetyltransferase
MTAADAAQVAALAGELGYPSTPAQIETRFRTVQGNPDSRAFVASDARGHVQGWVHVYGRHHLESDGTAEIGGLVVAQESRGQGVGRALMGAAESWAREHGYQRVRLGSNIVRVEAHDFYKRLGYSVLKTHHRFQKLIG